MPKKGEVTYEIRADDSHLDSDLDAARKKVEKSTEKTGDKVEQEVKKSSETVKKEQKAVTASHENEQKKQEKQGTQTAKTFKDLAKDVGKEVSETIGKAGDGAGKTLDAIKHPIKTVSTAAKEKIGDIAESFEKVKEATVSGMAKAANALLHPVETAKKTAGVIKDVFSAAFTSVADMAVSAGKTTAKAIGAAVVSAGAATVTASVAATKSAVSLDQAMNQFAAATGKGTEETERYRNVLESIYANNYGESFEDIADAMAQVGKQMGDLSDDQLQSVTESAFALRDTFEYDIPESTRAAKAMMDNFGVSGDQAMGLIAAGAQNGLDYSGELLDSISEYSVQFAKVGLDADDMFKIFQEGADSGAFNLDKIGDAVKEMSIRVIDGSDTTKEGFETIGLNAEDMAAKFAAGGDSARAAFTQTIQALAAMEDPLAQNTAGVDLFGTMWEDLGPDVVTQLASIEDGLYDTSAAMDGIKSTKYNDIGSMFEGLKRSAEMLIKPIGDKLIPLLSDLTEDAIGELQNCIPPLVDTIGGFIDGLMPVIEDLLPVLFDLIESLLPPLTQILGDVLTPLIGLIAEIAPMLSDLLSGILPILIDLCNQILPPLMQIISALLPPLIELASALLPIFQSLITLLEPIISMFVSLLDPIVKVINEGLTPLINTISSLIDGAIGPLKAAISVMASAVGSVLTGMFSGVQNIFNNLRQVFQGIIDFIGGIFTGNWKRVWEGVKSIFSGICSAIGNIFKAPINFIIDGINGFIRGLNKIKIPDWVPVVGGAGFSISEIPRLKVGMDFVPSDYYPAFLDKGERVLTAEENLRYNMLGGISGMERMLDGLPGAGGRPDGNGQRAEGEPIDYDRLAQANAKAMEGMTMECDKREFGRIVREVQD